MLTLTSPAKINWFLNVSGRRPDGYHDILSLMQCITLEDSIAFELSDVLEVISDLQIPLTENLVYKAALLLKEISGIDLGAKIFLKKDIPLSAGLGGGSSDAAATLVGLNRLWGLNLKRQDLIRLGETLGSDIPFFFNSPAAVVEGRGEIVSSVRLSKSYVILLVKPVVAVSSAWAYAEFDRLTMSRSELTKEADNITLIIQALEQGDYFFLATKLKNDLEPHVISRYPVIGDIKTKLLQKGAVMALMSGSGSAVFGVFDSEHLAGEAMQQMAPNWCRIVKTITGDGQQE